MGQKPRRPFLAGLFVIVFALRSLKMRGSYHYTNKPFYKQSE